MKIGIKIKVHPEMDNKVIRNSRIRRTYQGFSEMQNQNKHVLGGKPKAVLQFARRMKLSLCRTIESRQSVSMPLLAFTKRAFWLSGKGCFFLARSKQI